jgi:hypothetical protein
VFILLAGSQAISTSAVEKRLSLNVPNVYKRVVNSPFIVFGLNVDVLSLAGSVKLKTG